MMVKQFRLERGWSQEQLAQLSGLNIRTIQRVESGSKAGLETLKALAAVFDVSIHQLQQEPAMEQNTELSKIALADHPKTNWVASAFPSFSLRKLVECVVLIAFLFGVNLLTSTYLWAVWPAMCIILGFVMSSTKQLKNAKSDEEE